MSELRGIDAEYVNWRTVMGRKVLQLVFEIDIARQQEVLTMLGTPTVGESKWVAIAPLQLKAEGPSEPKANGSPKKFHDLPLSQQAAIRCGDAEFQEYLGEESEAGAADYVRRHCGVKSRSKITDLDMSGPRWWDIEAKYQAWLTDRKFAEAKR